MSKCVCVTRNVCELICLRVCLTCYKSHLVILKENQPISKDEDLKVLIDTLGRQTSIMGNVQDIICAATIRMLVTVGKMLMENRAMLLPTIHSDFIHYARGLFAAKGMQDPQELKSICSRSVFSEITAQYQHHVTYTCKVRKHGTLVYRHILELLSEALWKLKQAHVEPITSEALDTSVSTCPDPPETCNIGHVVWDKEENMQLVRERVNLLLRGCKCVTGCKNRVCGCKRKNSKCTEGCQCINCENEDSPVTNYRS